MPRSSPYGPDCRHCGQPRGCGAARGLCQTCYKDRGIRDRYAGEPFKTPEPEPTEAELDALIARQRQRLPAWWNDSGERAKTGGRA